MALLAEGIENAVSVKVFDLSIPIEERKPIVFDSKADAAKSLGVAPSTLSKHIGVGKHLTVRDKKYAIRINHERSNNHPVQK